MTTTQSVMTSTTQPPPVQQDWREIIDHLMNQCFEQGATDAEVSVNLSQGFSVTVRQGEIDKLEQQNDQSLVLTVYCDQRQASVSTTDLTATGLQSLAHSACEIAQLTQPDPYAGLAEADQLADLNQQPDLQLYQPWSLTIDEASDKALTLEKQAVSYDQRLSGEETTIMTTQNDYIYANSRGFYGRQPHTVHEISCVLLGQDEHGAKERDYAYSVARSAEQLLSIDSIAQLAAQRTYSRLGSQCLSTTQAPILFTPRVAQGLISSFLSAISGSKLYRHASFLQDHLGELIFPEFVQIEEQPHLLGGLNSSYFDADGVATYSKPFVDQGRLQSYCLDVYSARRLNMTTTANGGGIHNLVVAADHQPDYDQLIQQMDRGLIVTEVMGHGVNLVTGDYSQGAAGFWVENGEIQYPVSELTIAGQLKTMFRDIIAVGADVDYQSNIQTGSILVNNMTIAGH